MEELELDCDKVKDEEFSTESIYVADAQMRQEKRQDIAAKRKDVLKKIQELLKNKNDNKK